jgi:hypothetical protein
MRDRGGGTGGRIGGGSALPFDSYPMSPGDFVATATGTPPTLTNNNNCQVWSFADGATGEVVTSFYLPASWRQVAVGFFWINPGADITGAVRWRVAIKKLDNGNLTTEAFAVDTAANVTTAAQNVVSLRGNHITGFDVTPGIFGSTYSMLISRIGADAGDDIANAAEFHSLLLLRTG